ncbi:MAG: hypothetical protein WD696_22765 [Bryobacteraceae bacterium]
MHVCWDVPENLPALDEFLEGLPNSPAVFLVWPRTGDPYLGKTSLLRRRLKRLLHRREIPSRLLNLRDTAARIEYRLTGSPFETSIRTFEWARMHFPGSYLEHIRLRMPPYLKITLDNRFPRSVITSQLSRSGLFFGPFRSRASAERFEGEFLNLFQMRRCAEDLEPNPAHPGCIYGEMGMCLRPCQERVGAEEYGNEVERVTGFLVSSGRNMLETVAASRDRLSEEQNFEEAARQHRRFEKIQEILSLRDDLAAGIDRLHGVVVTPSAEPKSVDLWFVHQGHLQNSRTFPLDAADGRPLPLDRRLRDTLAAVPFESFALRERQERLALLSRWFYSSWREGEWLNWDNFADVPYRKLVRAVSRIAGGVPV